MFRQLCVWCSNVNKGSGRRPIDIPREEDTSGSQQPPLVSGAGELSAPLAEVMRPTSIEEYVGQEGIIGKNAILRTILESGQVPSLIFWGPPGCGKVMATPIAGGGTAPNFLAILLVFG